MQRALIIGGSGFVGDHLARHLLQCGYGVTATGLPTEAAGQPPVRWVPLDILDAPAVAAVLRAGAYDHVYHLAAQSSVALSWQNPALTVDVNIKGCCHLLQAVQELEHRPRVLLVGSAEEYGPAGPGPVEERTPPRPANVYAATKVCQNMLGKLYADAYGLDIRMVRAFNHIGPGQSPQFAVSSFCRQVAQMEAGQLPPVLRVGNLSAQRDFTDVRDVVRAYELILRHGAAGETYNVGSGRPVAIGQVVERILALARCPIAVQADEALFRPVDVPALAADTGKLSALTGWRPCIALEQTLGDCLQYWRQKV